MKERGQDKRRSAGSRIGRKTIILSELQKQEREGGLACPDCGCKDFRAANTVRIAGGIRRYKVCRHCGRRIRTREKIEP